MTEGLSAWEPDPAPEPLTCIDCGQELRIVYPDAPERYRYGHTSSEDAHDCVGRRPDNRPWPQPRERPPL